MQTDTTETILTTRHHCLLQVARGIRMDTLDLQRHMGSYGIHCVPSHLAKQLLGALVDSSQQLLAVCGIDVVGAASDAVEDTTGSCTNFKGDKSGEAKCSSLEPNASCVSCRTLRKENEMLARELEKQRIAKESSISK
jgi:hypothetical protein